MGKHKYFKVMGFLDFWFEAEIHAVPKIREKRISMVQEKYGKPQIFQIHAGFLNISGETEIHTVLKIWGK